MKCEEDPQSIWISRRSVRMKCEEDPQSIWISRLNTRMARRVPPLSANCFAPTPLPELPYKEGVLPLPELQLPYKEGVPPLPELHRRVRILSLGGARSCRIIPRPFTGRRAAVHARKVTFHIWYRPSSSCSRSQSQPFTRG